MKRRYLYTLAALFVLASMAAIYAGHKTPAGAYPEAATIGENVRDFKELSERFSELAKSKGGVYAYQVLARAKLPPNTDLHLLGHVVGDELYKQKGVDGIADCTQDFRNACSHTIAVGTLNEFGGTKALALIRDACKKAPGGSGAYTMCYHGLGHGVFAYYGYDLSKTVDFCRKTGTAEYNQREYQECVGGSIMELTGGGGHDRDLWLKARQKYFSSSDPLAPCSTKVIPNDAKGICYTYITPHLFAPVGENPPLPTPDDFVSAFQYCDRISKKTPELRETCFGGIGKEFPVLALLHDIRTIAQASDAQLQQMRNWCSLAPHAEAYAACEQAIISSLYWGGENDPSVSTRFCALAKETERSSCFSVLFKEAAFYAHGKSEPAERMCSQVPEEFKNACRSTFSAST